MGSNFQLTWPLVNGLRGRLAMLSLVCGLSAGQAACGGSDGADPLVVATEKGEVKGVERSGARQYLGIPYAAAPVAARRWQPPQAVAAWTGARDASHFANHCPQPETPFGHAENSSEDCLYLNVYRPTGAGPFPVMVWIHGGGLWLGETDDYDPSQMAAEGVVVVTVNYRLGALGFLAHPALSAEAGGSSGNYGLMDQQAALRWVQANIAAFGGDRGNVTLFGESAGGHSVHAHLASPLSAGLFHKAIVQSGSYSLDTPSLASAQAKGEAFAAAAGCSEQTAACLRRLDLGALLANQEMLFFGTGMLSNIDNKLQPRSHREAFASGNFQRVPMIEGSNALEHSMLTASAFDFNPPPKGLGPVTADNYRMAQGAALGFYDARKSPAQVDAVYPLAAYAGPVQAIDAIAGDSGFACPSLGAVRTLSAYTPVYQYEFNDPDAPMLFMPPTASHPKWGAYHAAELQYLFRVKPTWASAPAMNAAQQALSAQMIGLWTRFARTGNPNAAGSTLWPVFQRSAESVLSLETGGLKLSRSFSADHRCDFWLAP